MVMPSALRKDRRSWKGKEDREVDRSEIHRYVTEEANTQNCRRVELVDIRLPNSKLKDGLVLYDTPE